VSPIFVAPVTKNLKKYFILKVDSFTSLGCFNNVELFPQKIPYDQETIGLTIKMTAEICLQICLDFKYAALDE